VKKSEKTKTIMKIERLFGSKRRSEKSTNGGRGHNRGKGIGVSE